MPANPLLPLPTAPLLLVSHGPIVGPPLCCDADYTAFIRLLTAGARRCRIEIYAYALMSWQVQFLIEVSDAADVSRLMTWLQRGYRRYRGNRVSRYRESESMNYQSCWVERESFLGQCARFIAWLPVGAGLAATPAAYKWSSHGAQPSRDIEPVVTRSFSLPALEPPSPSMTRRIGHALTHGYPLGSASFRAAIEDTVDVDRQRFLKPRAACARTYPRVIGAPTRVHDTVDGGSGIARG